MGLRLQPLIIVKIYINATLLVIINLVALSLSEEAADISTLRLVHVLYRHGDRSTITPYKGDPVKESDWPQGFGQLTQTGMEQEYELGQFLRRRYINSGFMDKKYERSQIYVRSTNIDRALMSAYCVLSGLYPPNNTQLWNGNITWQPIPVHTIPNSDDYLLLLENCPNFGKKEKGENEFIETQKRVFYQKHQDVIDFVHRCTGVTKDLDGFLSTLDPIFCESRNGKSIPNCIKNSTFLNNIVQYRDFAASIAMTTYWSKRLKGGAMLKTFINQMQTKTQNITAGYLMYMYSAHDSNIIALLQALGVFDNKQPPYSACIMIELHETKPHKFDVRIYHKNVSDSSVNVRLRRPHIPGCPSSSPACPLETFIEVLHDMIPTDVKSECGVDTGWLIKTDYVAGISVLSLAVIIFIILLAGVCIHYRRKSGMLMYRRIPTDDL